MTAQRSGRTLLAATAGTVLVLVGVLMAVMVGRDDDGGAAGPRTPEPTETNLTLPTLPDDTGSGFDPDREGPVTIEGAETGGVVKVVSATPLETMDPSEAYYVHTVGILSGLVTRSLTQWAYDPEANDGTGGVTLVPDLATDLGRHNDDYTEWSFTLRSGIRYEDGTPVTAEDVKFGLERTLDLSTFPESPGFYGTDHYLGGAAYGGPYTAGGAGLDAITVDGDTVTIRMAKPFPEMPLWMAFPANGPIPQGADPESYGLHPLATGPYKFDDYEPRERLTLVRNEYWDPTTDPARTAYPDGYEMDFTATSAEVDEVILADVGEGADTMTFDNISATSYERFRDEAPDRIQRGTSPCTRYLAFDTLQVPDIRVRRAIAYAYPTAEAIEANGDLLGVTRVPATTLLPPGTPGRVEHDALPGYTPGRADPEQARALLEEADATGFEVRFLFAADDPASVATKDVVAQALEDAGFRATPVPSTLLDITVRHPDDDVSFRVAGWCGDFPSGSGWFPVLLGTETLGIGTISPNGGLFSEADVDARMDAVRRIPFEEQPLAWGQLGNDVNDEYFPLFPVSYDGTAWAAGSHVHGNWSDIVLGMPTYKNVWLTQD